MSKLLKPCPFCGGDARSEVKTRDGYPISAWVQCTSCDARTSSYRSGVRPEGPDGEARACDAWNRRAS